MDSLILRTNPFRKSFSEKTRWGMRVGKAKGRFLQEKKKSEETNQIGKNEVLENSHSSLLNSEKEI